MERMDDNLLENITGGQFNLNRTTNTLTYINQAGTVAEYEILNYDKAWDLINTLSAQNIPEDLIIAKLIGNGYLQ